MKPSEIFEGENSSLRKTFDSVSTPEVKEFEIYGKLVRISSVPGFTDWLYGQTMPLVEGDPTPYDWAYFGDYIRFSKKLPIRD